MSSLGSHLMLALCIACGCAAEIVHPTCDEAINTAATKHGSVRGLGLGSPAAAISACENERWPVSLRICIRDATTQTLVRDCIVSGVSGPAAPPPSAAQ